MADAFEKANKELQEIQKEDTENDQILQALQAQVQKLKSLLTIAHKEAETAKAEGRKLQEKLDFQESNSFRGNQQDNLQSSKQQTNRSEMSDISGKISSEVVEKLGLKISQSKQQLKEAKEQLKNLQDKIQEIEQDSSELEFLKQMHQSQVMECNQLAEQVICIRSDLDKSQNDLNRLQRSNMTNTLDSYLKSKIYSASLTSNSQVLEDYFGNQQFSNRIRKESTNSSGSQLLQGQMQSPQKPPKMHDFVQKPKSFSSEESLTRNEENFVQYQYQDQDQNGESSEDNQQKDSFDKDEEEDEEEQEEDEEDEDEEDEEDEEQQELVDQDKSQQTEEQDFSQLKQSSRSQVLTSLNSQTNRDQKKTSSKAPSRGSSSEFFGSQNADNSDYEESQFAQTLSNRNNQKQNVKESQDKSSSRKENSSKKLYSSFNI